MCRCVLQYDLFAVDDVDTAGRVMVTAELTVPFHTVLPPAEITRTAMADGALMVRFPLVLLMLRPLSVPAMLPMPVVGSAIMAIQVVSMKWSVSPYMLLGRMRAKTLS